MFDIDLTDYDDVRTCGDGGHICSRCWPFMALAIKVSGLGAVGARRCSVEQALSYDLSLAHT